MGENSGISWTDHTFNPWWGCTKVGPGCDHCYAETFDRRVGGDHWGAGKPRRLVKDWTKPRKWQREAARTGVRPWVFCASMADVFDNEVPAEWRAALWELIEATPDLNWILVTKRIGNVPKMVPASWPLPNVGLCITVVNQEEADRDVPKLLATPAPWRGISAEPLLGEIILARRWLGQRDNGAWGTGRLDWVIVGGESGPKARPMRAAWARSIRDQCAAAGVSFHFKQWGEWIDADEWLRPIHDSPWISMELDGKPWNPPMPLSFSDAAELAKFGDDPVEHQSDGSTLIRVGKRRSGRLLDGAEHNGMPPAARRAA